MAADHPAAGGEGPPLLRGVSVWALCMLCAYPCALCRRHFRTSEVSRLCASPNGEGESQTQSLAPPLCDLRAIACKARPECVNLRRPLYSVHTREPIRARKALVTGTRRKGRARQLAACKDLAPASDSHHQAIVRSQASLGAAYSAVDAQVGRLIHHLCLC